ncbi:hypothetical protein D9619_008464 [Psilocybe cf. subviscida]|uniref:Uncharacterized protein n=1 Tax=Psilocybe cf. subviscida TaxID=2480587 RepID=A0A8H5BCE9_9AGAR|nr:hypothetical protein D9619_008464 [Psilocybe cf. subviscida]
MHQRLVNDDLLESRSHPAIPDSVLRHLVIPLTSFGQSFVVDLTTRNLAPSFVTSLSPPTVLELGLLDVFRETSIKNRKNPLFSGRAVVRLEPYPTSISHKRTNFPLLTLRCLEHLTPVKRLSDSDRLLDPAPGQLFMRKMRTFGHVPLPISPLKVATREALMIWIDTQPPPPLPPLLEQSCVSLR